MNPDAIVLDRRSVELRQLATEAMIAGGRGHLSTALSCIDILRVLYDDVLRVRAEEPDWDERDIFILSKGHGCLALYAILADKGYFPKSELERFEMKGSMLGGHPEAHRIPGVEASTGALGHGLPIGVGIAVGDKIKRRDRKVVVLVGDGESSEGTVWEAALLANKHRLTNLTVIVDYNKFQCHGPIEEIQSLEPLADKWRSFGFEVAEVDGHDVSQLRKVLTNLPLAGGRPSCVICHTVKGKGIPMITRNPAWHHKYEMSEDEIAGLRSALARETVV